MSFQVRWWCSSSSRRTWALVAATPPRSTGSASSAQPPTSTRRTSGHDLVEVGPGVEQRAEGHVAGHPGEAVEPGHPALSHGPTPVPRSRATAQAAPKPLSMPTTVTPAAHDESMASSAVTPSSDAPYPTLVGTATTGAGGQPADDRGQGSLHAGHDDHDVGVGHDVDLGEQPVEAGHADVGEPPGRVAEGAEGRGALVGHGEVRGAGADHDDRAGPGRRRAPHDQVVRVAGDLAVGVGVQGRGGLAAGRPGSGAPGRRRARSSSSPTRATHCSAVFPGPYTASGSRVRSRRWWSTRANPRSEKGSRRSRRTASSAWSTRRRRRRAGRAASSRPRPILAAGAGRPGPSRGAPATLAGIVTTPLPELHVRPRSPRWPSVPRVRRPASDLPPLTPPGGGRRPRRRRGRRPADDALLADLRAVLRRLGQVVVAFSGGADSAFLAWVAHDTLGAGAVAVTAVSPSLAADERDDCRRPGGRVGPRLARGRHPRDGRRALPGQRRRSLRLVQDGADGRARAPGAAVEGATVVLGVNVDDLGDHRPGQHAAAERGAAFPLVEAGLTKADVRAPVATPRPAHVGQAGGGLPGLPDPLRHAGRPRPCSTGSAGPRPPCGGWACPRSGCATTATPPASRSPSTGWPGRRRPRGGRRRGRRRPATRWVTLDLEGLRSGNLNADLAAGLAVGVRPTPRTWPRPCPGDLTLP